MAYIPGPNGGRINVSLSGANTAGALAAISSGTMYLAGGNNVTLSQNANSITISGNGLTSQSNQALSGSNGSFNFQTATFGNLNGMSFYTSNGSMVGSYTVPTQTNQTLSQALAGNTTGNTSAMTVDARSLTLQGLGNASVGISTSAGGSSLIISGSQSLQTQSNIQGVIASGSSNYTGNISFANSNNITFGLSNNTVTASFAGGGVALRDAANTISSGTASISAAGALTASINGQTLSLSVPNSSSLSGTGIVSLAANGSTLSIGAAAYSAGISNGVGNTSGSTGFATNQLVLAGGNNITLSQATGGGGNTITIVGAAGGGGGVGLSAGTQSISTGTVNFANSNGISFGMSGSSQITASYTVPTQTNPGFSAQGGSSSFQTLSFSNGNGVSFTNTNGQVGATVATNYAASNHSHGNPTLNLTNLSGTTASASNGLTLSLSAAPMFDAGVSTAAGGTVAGGGTTSNTGGLAFFAGSNINLSQATAVGGNASITISAAAGGGGGGIAIANTQTTYTSGTVRLVEGAGAITINSSTNGASQSLQFNVPATSSLVGVNGIAIASAGGTISIDGAGAGAGGTLSNWEPMPIQYGSVSNTQKGNGFIFFYKLQPMAYVSATRMLQLVSMSVSSSSNSSHAGVISIAAGIYTANGSTLSQITDSSGSAYYQWTNTSGNSNSLLTGLQGLTIPMNVNMSPGNYWLGMWSRTSSSGANWFTASNIVFTNNNSSYQGLLLQASASSEGLQEGVGYYSASSTTLPASMPMSSIRQSLFRSNAIPYINFKNMTW